MNTFPLHQPRSASLNWSVSPIVSVLGVALGTILAILTTPEYAEQPFALQLPTTLLAIGLLIGPVLNTIYRSPASIVHPANIIVAAPVYWLLLDPLQGAYELSDVTQSDVRMSFAVIGIFSSSIWLAALQRHWRLPDIVSKAASVPFSASRLFTIAIVAFILALLRFAIPAEFDIYRILGAFDSMRWNVPWARGQLGGWNSFLDHSVYFGYVLPSVAVIIGRTAGWRDVRTIATFVFAFAIIALVSTDGNRRNIGVMIGSGIVVWFLTANPPALKHLVITAVLGGLLLGMLQLIVIYRNVGILKIFDTEEDHRIQKPSHLHVDDNFLRLNQVVAIFPHQKPHITWKWLLWVAIRPVPRIFWANKPMDPGFDLAAFKGQRNVSLTCSLIGELYMAFGILGCIAGGWCFGILAFCLAQVVEQNRGPGAMVIFGSGLLALFAGIRSVLELVLMSYAIICWILLAGFYASRARTSRISRRFAE